jgi:hypothetical protein
MVLEGAGCCFGDSLFDGGDGHFALYREGPFRRFIGIVGSRIGILGIVACLLGWWSSWMFGSRFAGCVEEWVALLLRLGFRFCDLDCTATYIESAASVAADCGDFSAGELDGVRVNQRCRDG